MKCQKCALLKKEIVKLKQDVEYWHNFTNPEEFQKLKLENVQLKEEMRINLRPRSLI